MKKIIYSIAIATLAIGCVNNPDGVEAETTSAQSVLDAEGVKFAVDATASTIEWHGNKVSGKHHGTIKVKEGSLTIADGQLSAGNFTIDMASLNNLDITDAEYKGQLEGHLKSDDFFAVDKFPTSKFEITGVNALDSNKLSISGNLTIRDTTNNITFEAQVVENTPERFVANADFNINRKNWNVLYPGQADDLIADEINFKINLVSVK